MFIKNTRGGSKNKPNTYLQLAHNYRKDGKVKQKIICTLGRKEELERSGQIDALITKLTQYSKKLLVINTETDKIKSVKLYGTTLAVNSLWKKLDLEEVFSGLSKQYKFEFDINTIVKTLVINRLSEPKSKLGIERWQENVYGIEGGTIELHNIYRALDYLALNKDIIEKHLYETTTGMFKSAVSVIFYDLTTIYLESQQEDALKKFGYSKENKTDCVQVVMGLIINKDGLPLGYEMFPGNTFEGKTVCTMLEKLQKQFMLKQLIFVADKGILSESVLSEIEGKGYEYIVAAKLSQTPSAIHKKIMDRSAYENVTEDISSSEIEVKGRRLVLGYSKNRASRDKYQREAIIKKLETKIKKNGINAISKAQYNKYLEKTGIIEIKLSESKIKQQELWDGYFGFYTNCTMSSIEVVNSYRMLWQIEDSFRTLKSTLDIRPMFHWTDKRIEGHIMLCFVSLYILRAMEFYTSKSGLDLSPMIMLDALQQLKAIELQFENKTVIVRNEITGITNEVLRALNIKIPPFILESDKM